MPNVQAPAWPTSAAVFFSCCFHRLKNVEISVFNHKVGCAVPIPSCPAYSVVLTRAHVRAEQKSHLPCPRILLRVMQPE